MPDPFIEAARNTILESTRELRSALTGASAEALNWEPAAETNSLAQMTTHALNALNTWVCIATNHELPARNRAAEFHVAFADDAAALAFVDERERTVLAVLDAAGPIDWQTRHQTHPRATSDAPDNVSSAYALIHALEHLREHTGQVLLTRQLWNAR